MEDQELSEHYKRFIAAVARFRDEVGDDPNNLSRWAEIRDIPFAELKAIAEFSADITPSKSRAFLMGYILGWEQHAESLARNNESL